MRFLTKRLTCFLPLAALLGGLVLSAPVNAGITGYLIVHNTTSQTLSIYVNGDQFRGRVPPGDVARYLIGDSAESVTTFAAYSQRGGLVKSGSVAGNVGDHDWWVP